MHPPAAERNPISQKAKPTRIGRRTLAEAVRSKFPRSDCMEMRAQDQSVKVVSESRRSTPLKIFLPTPSVPNIST